jgi:hypothetical protein
VGRSPKLVGVAVVVGVLATVAVACSSAGTTVADPPSSTAASPSASTVPPSRSVAGPTGVPEVLDFTAPSLGGGSVNGSDYVGKDVAIWFWAPW